jgi:hypothetical protein
MAGEEGIITEHAQLRARERYGLKFDEECNSHFIDMIQSRRTVPLESRYRGRRVTHAVPYRGRVYAVVYSKDKR